MWYVCGGVNYQTPGAIAAQQSLAHLHTSHSSPTKHVRMALLHLIICCIFLLLCVNMLCVSSLQDGCHCTQVFLSFLSVIVFIVCK